MPSSITAALWIDSTALFLHDTKGFFLHPRTPLDTLRRKIQMPYWKWATSACPICLCGTQRLSTEAFTQMEFRHANFTVAQVVLCVMHGCSFHDEGTEWRETQLFSAAFITVPSVWMLEFTLIISTGLTKMSSINRQTISRCDGGWMASTSPTNLGYL